MKCLGSCSYCCWREQLGCLSRCSAFRCGVTRSRDWKNHVSEAVCRETSVALKEQLGGVAAGPALLASLHPAFWGVRTAYPWLDNDKSDSHPNAISTLRGGHSQSVR